MAVRSKNAHWKLTEIKPRLWDAVTRLAGLGDAGPLLQEIAEQVPSAIEAVNRQVPNTFPAAVHDKIFQGLQRTAGQLLD